MKAAWRWLGVNMRTILFALGLLILATGSAHAQLMSPPVQPAPYPPLQIPYAPAPEYTIPSNVHCNLGERMLPTCYLKSWAGYARLAREHRDVAKLVSAGDCDGAVRRALQENDWETAEHAKSLCVPVSEPLVNAPLNLRAPALPPKFKTQKRADPNGEVARLVAAGDCYGATRRALQANDFEEAEHVKSLCVPEFGHPLNPPLNLNVPVLPSTLESEPPDKSVPGRTLKMRMRDDGTIDLGTAQTH